MIFKIYLCQTTSLRYQCGELPALPRPYSWIQGDGEGGKGERDRERLEKRKGRKGKWEGEGKGKRREKKGEEGEEGGKGGRAIPHQQFLDPPLLVILSNGRLTIADFLGQTV